MHQEDEKKLSLSSIPYHRINTMEAFQSSNNLTTDFHGLISPRDSSSICAYFSAYDSPDDFEEVDKIKLNELLQQQSTHNLHFFMTTLLNSDFPWRNALAVQRNFYNAVPEIFIKKLENLLNQDTDIGIVMDFIENNKKLFWKNYMSLSITEKGFKTLVEALDILSALKKGFKEDVDIIYNVLHKYKEKSQTRLLKSFFYSQPENKYRYFYLKLTEKFLRRYCNPAVSGGLEREIKCQILFIGLLTKNHDFKKFWFSFNLMSDIFLGQGQEKSSVPQQKKLTKMLSALSKQLPSNLITPPKFSTIPNIFVYLAVCLLKHKQFFSLYRQTNLKPLLKIINSWEEAACITFAGAILDAPLPNSFDHFWLKEFLCNQLSREANYETGSKITQLLKARKNWYDELLHATKNIKNCYPYYHPSFFSEFHVISNFYHLNLFKKYPSQEAFYKIFRPLFYANQNKEKENLKTYLQEINLHPFRCSESKEPSHEFSSDLVDLLLFFNPYSKSDLAAIEFFNTGFYFNDIFKRRLTSSLNDNKHWGFLPAFDFLINNQGLFYKYFSNSLRFSSTLYSPQIELTLHGFYQLIRVFDKMETQFLEYQQGSKFEDFQRVDNNYLNKVQPNDSKLEFYKNIFSNYNFYITPEVDISGHRNDHNYTEIRISQNHDKIICSIFRDKDIESNSFILTNNDVIYYVDNYGFLNTSTINEEKKINSVENVNRHNIPLATKVTKIDHPKYFIAQKSIKQYFIKRTESKEVTHSTKKAQILRHYFDSQDDKDSKKQILSYLIQNGSNLDFIENLCEVKNDPEVEWECHELLLQFLIKNLKELIPSDPLWRSYHTLVNIFTGIWFDTHSKANITASRHVKLKRIIGFITSHLPPKTTKVIPLIFNYLATCLLSHRQDCPEVDIKEHLLSIVGWGESRCLNFAQAILTCPFINSEDKELRQGIYAKLLSLLSPDKSEIKNEIKSLTLEHSNENGSKISMVVPDELVDRLTLTEIKVEKIERELFVLGLEKATNAILKQKFSPMDNPGFEDEYQQLKSIVRELKSEEKSGKMNQQQIQQLAVIAAEMIDAQRHQQGQIKEIQGVLGQQPHIKKCLERITNNEKLNQYYEFVSQHLTQTIIAAIAISSSKIDLSMLKVGWVFRGLEKIATSIPFVGTAVSLLALVADPIQEANKIRKTRNLSQVARCFKNDILVARRVVMQFAIELTINKEDEICEERSASTGLKAKVQLRYQQLETFIKEISLSLSSKEQLNKITRLAIYDVATILDAIQDSQFASEEEILKLSQNEPELISRMLKVFIGLEHQIPLPSEEEKLPRPPRPSREEILARINSSAFQRKFALDERLRTTVGRLTTEIFTAKLDNRFENIKMHFSKRIELLLLKCYALATDTAMRESRLQKSEIPGIALGQYRYINLPSENLAKLIRLIFNFADLEAKYDKASIIRESEKLLRAITGIAQQVGQRIVSRYQQSLTQLNPDDLATVFNVGICRILTYLESKDAAGERDITVCLLHGCVTPNDQISAILSKDHWQAYELFEQVGIHTESGFYYHPKQPTYRYGYCEISQQEFSDFNLLSGNKYEEDKEKNHEKYKLAQSISEQAPELSDSVSTTDGEEKSGATMHQRVIELSRQVEHSTQQIIELSRQVEHSTQQNRAILNILKQLIQSPALRQDPISIPLTALLAASQSSDLSILRESKDGSTTLLSPSSSSSQTLWSAGPQIETGRQVQSTGLEVNLSLSSS